MATLKDIMPTGEGARKMIQAEAQKRAAAAAPDPDLGIMPTGEEAGKMIQAEAHEKRMMAPTLLTPTDKAVTPTPAASFEDMYKALHPRESDEDIAKREKKEKRNMLLARISDALAAFNQAYSNARGVKPTAEVGYAGRLRGYYDKLRKEREAKDEQYTQGLMSAKRFDESIEQIRIKNAMEARRQNRLERETRIKEEKSDAYRKYQDAVAQKNIEMAAYYRKKWEMLEAGSDLELANKEADIAAKRARANASNAQANAANARADATRGGKTSTTTTTDAKGGTTSRTTVVTPNGSNGGAGGGQGSGGQNGNKKKPNPMSGKKPNPMK